MCTARNSAQEQTLLCKSQEFIVYNRVIHLITTAKSLSCYKNRLQRSLNELVQHQLTKQRDSINLLNSIDKSTNPFSELSRLQTFSYYCWTVFAVLTVWIRVSSICFTRNYLILNLPQPAIPLKAHKHQLCFSKIFRVISIKQQCYLIST